MKIQQGFTLLEMLLVFAIFGLLVITGIRIYGQLSLQTEVDQINANVDALFQALGYYYQANCIQYKSDSTTVSKPGTLDPRNAPPNPFPIVIASDLLGFLTVPYPFPLNPISNTYVAQFNEYAQTRYLPTNPANATPLGTTYIWKAQVAVQVGKEKATTYKNWMAADCVSTLSGSTVTPCAKAVAGGDYIVWERLPSFASNQTHTDLWQSMQRVKLFTQMYTINPITSIAETGDQNYLCGG